MRTLPKTFSPARLLALGAVLLGFLLPQVSHGQEEEFVTVEFQTLAWDQAISDLVYLDRGNAVSLFIPNGAPGATMRYVGPPTLNFYTTRSGPEGETLYDLKASVNVSRTQGKYLLLFVPGDEASSLPYRVVALPDSAGSFGANAFNFYNLTKTSMAIRLDEDQFQLQPGRNQIVTLSGLDLKNVNVQMASQAQGEDWRLIYQSRWAAPGKRRAWIFIYREGQDRPTIRKYYQVN